MRLAHGEQGDQRELADNAHIAIHIAVGGLEQAECRGGEDAGRDDGRLQDLPEACSIAATSRRCGRLPYTPRWATKSANRLAAHSPPVATATSSSRAQALVVSVV